VIFSQTAEIIAKLVVSGLSALPFVTCILPHIYQVKPQKVNSPSNVMYRE
jgi:hypothetical protein